jgi:glucan phosphorylase
MVPTWKSQKKPVKKTVLSFGLKVEDVTRLNNDGSYNPWDVAEEYPEIKKVMSQLVDGTYNKESFDLFKELHDSIMYGTEGQCRRPVLRVSRIYRATWMLTQK